MMMMMMVMAETSEPLIVLQGSRLVSYVYLSTGDTKGETEKACRAIGSLLTGTTVTRIKRVYGVSEKSAFGMFHDTSSNGNRYLGGVTLG